MNVPDTCIVLIKSFKVDFKRPSKGAMIATATLTDDQQKLMQSTEKGETSVNVRLLMNQVKNRFNVKCSGLGLQNLS